MTSSNPTTTTTTGGVSPEIKQAIRKLMHWSETQASADDRLPRFRLSDIEDNEIVITAVEPFTGKYGAGSRVIFTHVATGERGVLLGNWTVIGKYLARLQANGELPVKVKIVKAQGKRYFDFADPLQPDEAADDAPQNDIPF